MKPPPDAEPEILDDAALAAVAPKELRAAYKELRAAYGKLHAKHHDRIAAALAERKADEKKTGGDVPYGYRLDIDGETLIEDEGEQAVIAEAVRLSAADFSLRVIAKELWRKRMKPRPIPSAERQPLKTKRPGQFDPTQIRRMLEAYKARTAKPAD